MNQMESSNQLHQWICLKRLAFITQEGGFDKLHKYIHFHHSTVALNEG